MNLKKTIIRGIALTLAIVFVDAGNLKGHVKYDGKAPKSKRLKMDADFDKPKAFLSGSILIGLYFLFWIVVAVVLPILSIGLRLYSKELNILKDHSQEPGT